MRKNRIATAALRSIKLSIKRFISLMLLSFLGVGVFVGIYSASADMTNSLDNYYDQYNLYDIKVAGTLGVTAQDVAALQKVEGVGTAEGSYTKTAIVTANDTECIVKFHSLTKKLNGLDIVEGSLPTKAGEVAIEEGMAKKRTLRIGDEINISDDDTFREKKLKVTAIVKSGLYVESSSSGFARGTTNLGNGTIDHFAYCAPDEFGLNYFTEIYLTADGAKALVTSTEVYKDKITQVTKMVEQIKADRQKARYNELYDTMKAELDKQEAEANEKLAAAKKELDAASEKLRQASSTLSKTQEKLTQSAQKLSEYQAELSKKEKELQALREQLNQGQKEYQAGLSAASVGQEGLDSMLQALSAQAEQLKQQLASLPEQSAEYRTAKAQLDGIKTSIGQLTLLKETSQKLAAGEKTYQAGKTALTQATADYTQKLSELNKGKAEYQKGQAQLETAKKDYQKGAAQYETQKSDAAEKIQSARASLEDMEQAKWYVTTRQDDNSYTSYVDDTNSIHNLAMVFPVVFFLIAILISLITMSRMVEDERGEIGTLKSLGFANGHIMYKYLLYAGVATIVGGVCGVFAGSYIIPAIIWNIYQILFDLPQFLISVNPGYAIVGVLLSTACICGAVIFAAQKQLSKKPSVLMRPKAPKSGKRVLLERVDFLWKRLRFSQKVTVRNLFRYKKRTLITVFCIIGSTALLLVGFGIRDSVLGIPTASYGKIFTYDQMVYVNTKSTESELQEAFDNRQIQNYVETDMASCRLVGEKKKYEANLFVPKDTQKLSDIVNLYDYKTNEKQTLRDGEALLTEKAADLLNVKVGDRIRILDNEEKLHEIKIGGIVKNYVNHNVYMTKETYEKTFGAYTTNVVYLNTQELSAEEDTAFAKDLLKNDCILAVSSVQTMISHVDDMLKSLDYVVLVLIVCAAILSFVILYNLSYINITERKREIATLKVLGFYDKEVDNYIIKENIFLTLIGIAFGLLSGIFLIRIIITTVEIERLRFLYHITPLSFVISACMMLLFTLIVNILVHFNLKRVDMIESLKSVE